METPTGNGGAWWGIVGGAVVAVIGGLSKLLPARTKYKRENDASLEEIRNKGIMEMLADYRQQVTSLRSEVVSLRGEVASVTAKYELELEAAEQRNDELSGKYSQVLIELTQLKSRMSEKERKDG